MQYIDIVMPDRNEEELIAMAEKLNYGALCFLYSLKDMARCSEVLKELQARTKVKLCLGIFCDIKAVSRISRINCLRVFDAAFKPISSIRGCFEQRGFNLVTNLELNDRKDHTHYANSGLDQVLCAMARAKNKIVCFNFNNVLRAHKEERAKLLGRIIQNIRFCEKYKVDIAIASFATRPYEMRYYHDLVSFLIALKAQHKSAHDAVSAVLGKVQNT